MSETSPTVKQVLAGAVKALGGQERPGQVQMAEAVAEDSDRSHHPLERRPGDEDVPQVGQAGHALLDLAAEERLGGEHRVGAAGEAHLGALAHDVDAGRDLVFAMVARPHAVSARTARML